MSSNPDQQWLARTVELAVANVADGGGPFGAVVVRDGVLLATGQNRVTRDLDPTAHAEVLALREAAAATGSWHLENTTLVVTLEPCAMCAGAILAARVPVVVFGAWDEKAGAAGSVYDLLRDRRLPHRVEVYAGVLADESEAMLKQFFQARR